MKRDANGYPIPDGKSDKFKIWMEEYHKDPSIENLRDGPAILMARMERRLRAKGKEVIQKEKAERQNQTAPEGVPPPKPQGKIAFRSAGEEAHAKKAVERGIYGSLEEYCQLRDHGEVGIYDENRTPTFGKK